MMPPSVWITLIAVMCVIVLGTLAWADWEDDDEGEG